MNPDNQAHGLFGGEFGYGQDYENAVFAMRPYYWGECDCGYDGFEWPEKHIGCYQNEYDALPKDKKESWSKDRKLTKALCKKYGLSYPDGSAVHCTCDYHRRVQAWHDGIGYPTGHKDTCATVLPNFHHKPSGLKISWYKYIGRGMSANTERPDNWNEIMAECDKSVPTKNKEA